MKRGVLIGLGTLCLLVGLVLVAGGAAVAAIFGSDGAIASLPARVHGVGVALVAENITVDESSMPMPEGIGTLTLTVTAPDRRQMFIGSAHPADVDAYLTGAPYDVVVDLTAGTSARTRPVPGTQQPPPPAGRTFWINQSTAASASLTARLQTASALVVMNADGSPGVTADVVATFRIAGAWTAAWTAVGTGALALILSGVAFWRARVARRRAVVERVSATSAAEAGAAGSTAATVLPGVVPTAPVSTTDGEGTGQVTDGLAVPAADGRDPSLDLDAPTGR